jgi:hypothetical protein
VDQSTSRSASTRSSAVTALQSMAGRRSNPPARPRDAGSLASGRAGGGARRWSGGARESFLGLGCLLGFGDFLWGSFAVCVCVSVSAERRGEDSRDAMRFAVLVLHFWVSTPAAFLLSGPLRDCWAAGPSVGSTE